MSVESKLSEINMKLDDIMTLTKTLIEVSKCHHRWCAYYTHSGDPEGTQRTYCLLCGLKKKVT